MRGGRALPNFFVHFSQTVYFGSIWGWGGRGRPLPNFFGTVVQVVLKNTLAIQKLQMFIILVTSLNSLQCYFNPRAFFCCSSPCCRWWRTPPPPSSPWPRPSPSPLSSVPSPLLTRSLRRCYYQCNLFNFEDVLLTI